MNLQQFRLLDATITKLSQDPVIKKQAIKPTRVNKQDPNIVEAHKCLICGCVTNHIGSLCEECFRNVTKGASDEKNNKKSLNS